MAFRTRSVAGFVPVDSTVTVLIRKEFEKKD